MIQSSGGRRPVASDHVADLGNGVEATIELAEIRRRLAAGDRPLPAAASAGPSTGIRPWQAATAVVVAPGDDGRAEVAFIRRSERPGDPWSGDMALPGGRRDAGDADLAATARRETLEEIGVPLEQHVARLPDQSGRSHPGLVAAFVHLLDERPSLHPDPREVAEALWIPVHRLLEPSLRSRIQWAGAALPTIEDDGRVIWGLTHRILRSFFDAIALRRDPGELRTDPVGGWD